STRGWVFAINADTGKLVWKAPVPHGGNVNSSVTVAERVLPAPAKPAKKMKRKAKRRTKHRSKRHVKAKRKPAPPRTAGTLYMAVTGRQKFENCPPGDPCTGPYVIALDQATGQLVWSSSAIDTQPGADVYGSPMVYNGVLLEGVSGGAAELGDESDR